MSWFQGQASHSDGPDANPSPVALGPGRQPDPLGLTVLMHVTEMTTPRPWGGCEARKLVHDKMEVPRCDLPSP